MFPRTNNFFIEEPSMKLVNMGAVFGQGGPESLLFSQREMKM
jgi:hypothetical protein